MSFCCWQGRPGLHCASNSGSGANHTLTHCTALYLCEGSCYSVVDRPTTSELLQLRVLLLPLMP